MYLTKVGSFVTVKSVRGNGFRGEWTEMDAAL